ACSRSPARARLAPGGRAPRTAAALARAWAASPQATAPRLLLLRAGYDEPRTNHRFWDEVKRKEYYLDLSYPERKVAIEYDGKHHFTPEQARQDHGKNAALHRAGWTVIRILADDLVEPATFFAQPDRKSTRLNSSHVSTSYAV